MIKTFEKILFKAMYIRDISFQNQSIVTKSRSSKCELKFAIVSSPKALGCESANKKANIMKRH